MATEIRTLNLGPCGCKATYTLTDVVVANAEPGAWDYIEGLHYCEEEDVD